jgi:hypothetical protein
VTSHTAVIRSPDVEKASSGSSAGSEPRTTRVNVTLRVFTPKFYRVHGEESASRVLFRKRGQLAEIEEAKALWRAAFRQESHGERHLA